MPRNNFTLLCAVLFLAGAGSVNAVEHGEFSQNDRKWVVKNTKDPVFMFMGADVGIGIRSAVQLFDRLAYDGQKKFEVRTQTTNKRLS